MTKKKQKKPKELHPQPLPLLGGFRVEVKGGKRGGYRVLVCSCNAIAAYSHTLVAFRHAEQFVAIRGEGLWCRTWGNRVAVVTGEVKEISFGEGEVPCES